MTGATVHVRRAFVTLASGRLIHYRRAGAGPVVLLLHPSPQSSAFSLPMLRRLAANFTVIAVDTPGYGLSEPLSGDPATPALADYLSEFVEFMDAMGLRRVAFYGNATGAEIAQLFAFAHPERVALCMLDYLRAGANYPAAYRPAFYTAKHGLISRIRVPATLTRWEGKPDLSEVERVPAGGVPSWTSRSDGARRAGPYTNDPPGA